MKISNFFLAITDLTSIVYKANTSRHVKGVEIKLHFDFICQHCRQESVPQTKVYLKLFPSPAGTCNHHTASGIYVYHLGKFVLFQEIQTAYAVQWMAVQVS